MRVLVIDSKPSFFESGFFEYGYRSGRGKTATATAVILLTQPHEDRSATNFKKAMELFIRDVSMPRPPPTPPPADTLVPKNARAPKQGRHGFAQMARLPCYRGNRRR